MTPREIDALEGRILPERRAYYAADFARLRAGHKPSKCVRHGSFSRYRDGCRCGACLSGNWKRKQKKGAA